MGSMTDAPEIIAALDAYHQTDEGILSVEAIERWFAESLEIVHDPPNEHDGLFNRSLVLAGKSA
jgi:hypothetical protein